MYDSAVTRYENADINLKTAQGNYDITVGVVLEENKTSAKASVNSASVAMEAASNALNNTVVYAPISGYIAGRNVNKGQIVSPGAEAFRRPRVRLPRSFRSRHRARGCRRRKDTA